MSGTFFGGTFFGGTFFGSSGPTPPTPTPAVGGHGSAQAGRKAQERPRSLGAATLTAIILTVINEL